MSVDKYFTQYRCPCGNGTFTEERHEDDYFRAEYYAHLDCEKCKKEYSVACESYWHFFLLHKTGERWEAKKAIKTWMK